MSIYIDVKKYLQGFILDIQFETKGSNIMGILGASGSGKTMLLRCISGLIKPDEGNIIINEKVLFDSKKKIDVPPQQRKCGFLFQNYALFPHLTIKDNIMFGLSKADKNKNEKVKALLKKYHLKGLEDRYPSQISGGQQQRAALARAMAIEPSILLLDEPFSALDEHLRAHMVKEMIESLKGFDGTTLFVTHNMDEVYRISDTLAVVKEGKIESFGKKEIVFQNPPTLETARITGCKNISKAFKKSINIIEIPEWRIEAFTDSKVNYQEGFAAIRANHIRINNSLDDENVFYAWVADISEAPFRVTLYLKIGEPSLGIEDYHVRCEISREKWEEIKELPQPIKICLPKDKILFLSK